MLNAEWRSLKILCYSQYCFDWNSHLFESLNLFPTFFEMYLDVQNVALKTPKVFVYGQLWLKIEKLQTWKKCLGKCSAPSPIRKVPPYIGLMQFPGVRRWGGLTDSDISLCIRQFLIWAAIFNTGNVNFWDNWYFSNQCRVYETCCWSCFPEIFFLYV